MAKPPAIIEPHEAGFSWRQYWNFYWPLSLTSLAMIFSRQFQNGTLGRFEDSTRELAIYSFAFSTFMIFNATMIFIPQLINALGHHASDRRLCKNFLAILSIAVSLPIAALGFTDIGRTVLANVFSISGDTLDGTAMYLRWMSPLVPMIAVKQYCLGILMQVRRSGMATVLNVVAMAAMVLTLLFGVMQGWTATSSLGLAHVVANVSTLFLGIWLVRRYGARDEVSDQPVITMAAIWKFYWPIATTSVMFALTRPLVFSFVNRTAMGEQYVAAIRISGDLAMLFQNNVNQFRNMFVTFGRTHMLNLRKFIALVTAVMCTIMLFVFITPLGLWFFRDVLGADGNVPQMARQCFAVTCLYPIVLATRNYYHGLAMVYGKTTSMAVGAVSRVGANYLACLIMLHFGWLNHVTGAFIIMAGFGAEALAVFFLAPKHRPQPVVACE